MSSRIFGSGIRRREDPRLITGIATYTDDITLQGMAYAAMLRSLHAHARITEIDIAAASAASGVIAVYTGADTEGELQPMPCVWLVPDSDLKVAPYPCIATDIVRYVDDLVAVVVAETCYQAYDALDLIQVDYEPLPAVTNPEQASAPGAPQLHADIPGNQAFHWTVSGGDIDAAFEQADEIITDRIVQQRLIPTAMETRAAVADYTAATGELTLWNTTQNPHILRLLCSAVTGIPEDRLRVTVPEVGGGFGSKLPCYPAEFVTVFCSKKLGRPIKWTETRSENYQATTHGRDHVQDVALAATKDGKITGLRSRSWTWTGRTATPSRSRAARRARIGERSGANPARAIRTGDHRERAGRHAGHRHDRACRSASARRRVEDADRQVFRLHP